jgi:hypothetical protein
MNRHLNLFHFFDGRDKQFIEDNLSRAFALCLKNDGMFLDHVLRMVLGTSLYEQSFSIDHPDRIISVDLQVNANALEGYRCIIAVACSGEAVEKFDGIEPRVTEGPITDVVLRLNDICVIFEFKRTNENCAAQLLGQAEVVRQACGGDADVIPVDLCWPKIVQVALTVLSVQKQMSNENSLTKDFAAFLESRYPEWFPVRCLKSIPFPSSDNDPNHHYLQARLKQIVNKLCGSDEEVVETGGRYAIGVQFGWAREVAIRFGSNDGQYLLVQIWPGDTRGQGWALFREGKQLSWPETVADYPLGVKPYLKFSHFTRGVCWVEPNPEQAKMTHCHDFFIRSTGKRKIGQWGEFDRVLSEIIPGWKQKKDWNGNTFERCFEQSDRNNFDVSAGFALTVKIPYEQAQEMDVERSSSSLSGEIKKIVDGFKGLV